MAGRRGAHLRGDTRAWNQGPWGRAPPRASHHRGSRVGTLELSVWGDISGSAWARGRVPGMTRLSPCPPSSAPPHWPCTRCQRPPGQQTPTSPPLSSLLLSPLFPPSPIPGRGPGPPSPLLLHFLPSASHPLLSKSCPSHAPPPGPPPRTPSPASSGLPRSAPRGWGGGQSRVGGKGDPRKEGAPNGEELCSQQPAHPAGQHRLFQGPPLASWLPV